MSFGSRSLPPETPTESMRMSSMKQQGCIACIKEGIIAKDSPLEIHHLLSGGIRLGHLFTVCLCKHHHRGSNVHNEILSGPSLAKNKREFERRYGRPQQLMDYQQIILGYPLIALPTKRRKGKTDRPSKIIPREKFV